MPIRTASIAEQDIVQSALWLERKQFGLGERFLAAVEETFGLIEAMPLACPTVVFQNIAFRTRARWLAIRGFPQLVIFTAEGDDMLVVGVLHPHQDLEAILRSRIGVRDA